MNLSVIKTMAGSTVSRATRESLNLCSRPLLLCTNRTSEATAPTHFHKPSGIRCVNRVGTKSDSLPLCTNRTSEATASTHLHKSSEATVSMASKYKIIHCPARDTICPRRREWGSDVRLSCARATETHLQKSAPCKRTLPTTHTNQGCVHTVKCFSSRPYNKVQYQMITKNFISRRTIRYRCAPNSGCVHTVKCLHRPTLELFTMTNTCIENCEWHEYLKAQ